MNKISIIIPTYKTKSEDLDRCLKSIKEQNFDSLEVLIIDDNENLKWSEQVRQLCDKYKYKYVKQEHGGVSKARNLGIALATGEYILFVDADDMLEDNSLSYMYEVAIDNNDDWLIGSMSKQYGLEREKIVDIRIDESRPPKTVLGKEYDPDIVENLAKGLFVDVGRKYAGYGGQPVGQLFKREFIGTTRFQENMTRSEDVVFDLELLKKINPNKLHIFNKPVYIYIQNSNSASHRYWSDLWNDVKVHVKAMDSFEGNLGITKQDCDYRFIYSYFNCLNQGSFSKAKDFDDDYREQDFNSIVYDKEFQERLKNVSSIEMFKIYKFFGCLTLLAKIKNYKLTKKIWEKYYGKI